MARDPATYVYAVVTIDGVDIPCDPESTDPGVLSGLKVTWGRDGRLTKPPSTTCEFQMVDPDGGESFHDVVRFNSRVDVSAKFPDGSSRYVFRGNVSDLSVERDEVGDTLVSVIAIDFNARLTGVTMGDNPWPQQSTTDRLAAMRAALPYSIEVGVVGSPGQFVTMAPLDVDNRSVADVFEDFAWSTGVIPWPISVLVSGSLTEVGAGYKFTNGTLPTVALTDTRTTRRDPTYGTVSSNQTVVLDACDVDLDGTAFSANPDDTPQPIRVSWGEGSDTNPTGTYVLDNVGVVADISRRFDVSANVVESSARQVALNWYGQMAKWSTDFDGPWRVGALHVDPDTVTGIDHFDRVLLYLLDSTNRIDRTVLLQQLPEWTPWRDKTAHTHEPNVVGRVQGGTYEFTGGRWVLDLQIAVERALQSALAPPLDVVVRPGDVVPYEHDTSTVRLVADPSTPWAVGATATFLDGLYGWDGSAWVFRGVQAIYVAPGSTHDVPHTDYRVRPQPSTTWGPTAYTTFSDGTYRWTGSTWQPVTVVTPGSTTTLPHTGAVVPEPDQPWSDTQYATFSDGIYRWDGNAWVVPEGVTLVHPYDTVSVAHNDPGVVAVPDEPWLIGDTQVYASARFADGPQVWGWARYYWQQLEAVAPGDTTRRAHDYAYLSPWPSAEAWADDDYATFKDGTYRWDGSAFVAYTPPVVITVRPGDTVTVPHDDPDVVAEPSTPWGRNDLAVFSDGEFTWDGSAWQPFTPQPGTIPVVPYSTHAEAYTDAGVVPVPDTVWPWPQYAIFSGGSSLAAWLETGTTGWATKIAARPGQSRPTVASTNTLYVPVPIAPWAAGESITFSDGVKTWDGTAWVAVAPASTAWQDAPEGLAWQDVPTGTAWTDWNGG